MPSSVAANGVTHLIWEREGWLVALLAEEYPELPALISLGAVYHNKKRLHGDTPIALGDYVRLHPHPRRFDIAAIKWQNRVVYENADFWIVDKPSGVPVHATVDNRAENMIAAFEPLFGIPPLVTHRLDTVTSGLVLLAKTDSFQRFFNRSLAAKKVGKSYLALSENAPSTGLWVHFMKKDPYAPKVISRETSPEGIVCETLVENSTAIGPYFETRLIPQTGRTHQLRVQMAFEGCPLLGDKLYGGLDKAGFGGDRVALHAEKLSFFGKDGTPFSFHLPPPWSPLRG